MPGPNLAMLPVGGLFHGHYRVVRCMSAGGMGAVYEVLELKTQRRRALKVMLPEIVTDPDLRARFRQEATITANIESEHIVETFDADVDPESGAPYLVMELLRGEDLRAILRRRRRLPAAEVVALLHQASLALGRTHAAGVVHRDLKPENLFVTQRDDGTPRLKILDFGIAKVVAQSQEAAKTTLALGTPLYMSPEQIRGDGTVGPRADHYALGQIAFTLLVGEAYWSAEACGAVSVYALVMKVAMGATEPATTRATRAGVTLPPAFDDWFAKATSICPEERFESATDLVEDLANVLGLALVRPSPSNLVDVAASQGVPNASCHSAPATMERTVPLPSVTTLGVPDHLSDKDAVATERIATEVTFASNGRAALQKRGMGPAVLFAGIGMIAAVSALLALRSHTDRTFDVAASDPTPMTTAMREAQPSEQPLKTSSASTSPALPTTVSDPPTPFASSTSIGEVPSPPPTVPRKSPSSSKGPGLSSSRAEPAGTPKPDDQVDAGTTEIWNR